MPGVFTVPGMGLQFPPGSIRMSIGGDGPDMTVAMPNLRHDLWFTWLEVGCIQATAASAAASRLAASLSDTEKAELLSEELRAGLVALTAFAFTFDGFYDVVKAELGDHPGASTWRAPGRRPTPRHDQITETLRYHFKLNPQFTAELKEILQQLSKFRGRAVHPSSRFVEANYRPELDSHVHPHFITFSGPHAVQARALCLVLLDRLVERGLELSSPGSETGWLTLGRHEVDRLSNLYRVPGDDGLAFPSPIENTEPPTELSAAESR